MASRQLRVTEPPIPPTRGVKASTWKLLLETGMRLIQQDGHIPSVAEVAVRSNVSRATAYRYFPSRSALVTAVIDTSLGPVRSFASDSTDGRMNFSKRPSRASRSSSRSCAPPRN
jgi:AcrR family transcriptional regulator